MDPPKRRTRTEGSSNGHELSLLHLLSREDILGLILAHNVSLLALTCASMWEHFVPIPVRVGGGCLQGDCTLETDLVHLCKKEFACMHVLTLCMVLDHLLELRRLNVESCTDLKVLPEKISNLIHLKCLDVQNCTALVDLPPDIGKLHGLTHLRVKYCNSLQLLPDEIGCLQSLRELDLSFCAQLTQLPENINGLTNLTSLALCWCKRLQYLPSNIETLHRLTKLDLKACSSLKILPFLPSVNVLVLSCCHGLPREINLRLFPDLEELDLGIWSPKAEFERLLLLCDNRRSLELFDPAVSSVRSTQDGRRSLIVEYDCEKYLLHV